MREPDGKDEERTERERKKKRDIFIEGVIVWLSRNFSLGKFPGIHKDDPC